MIQKRNDDKKPVGQENDFGFESDLYRLAERLMNALYLVSEHMEDSDIIKIKLRNHSIQLYEMVLGVSDKHITEYGLIRETVYLIGLLDLAYINNVISSVNSRILQDQLHLFIRHVKDTSGIPISQRQLYTSMFTDNAYSSSLIGLVGSKRVEKTGGYEYKGHVDKSANKVISRTSKSIGQGQENMRYRQNDVREVRQKEILEVTVPGQWYSVRDIRKSITGYSEKTIQRDLSDLVKKGLLRRKGERRWSVYSRV